LIRGGYLVTFLVAVAACSGSGFGDDESGTGADGSVDPDIGTTGNDASTTKDSGRTNDATSTKDSGTTQNAGQDSGTTQNAGQDSGTTQNAGQDSGTITADSGDGFGAVRTACINEINKLRATDNHKAYALWETPAIDQCVDSQATNDQTKDSPHYSWLNHVYPTCNGNAQDECLGYANTVSGIVACLDSMWAERLQSNCSGCAACNGPRLTQEIINCQSTSTCDFYGHYGRECGHYLNMSADYFTEAACGFSAKGAKEDWAVQNFK
jgi:hypothetical protein